MVMVAGSLLGGGSLIHIYIHAFSIEIRENHLSLRRRRRMDLCVAEFSIHVCVCVFVRDYCHGALWSTGVNRTSSCS